MAFFACPSPLHGLMRGPLGLTSVLGRGSGLSDSLTRSVSAGLSPSSEKVCSLYNVLFWFFFFGIELVCGLLPAQQSFLGFSNSPGMCPVKPQGLSCRGIPPAVLPQVWQGARCVKPLPRLASPLPGTALLLSALGRDNPCHRALSMGLVSSFSYIYC